jgi:hypothetical protein
MSARSPTHHQFNPCARLPLALFTRHLQDHHYGIRINIQIHDCSEHQIQHIMAKINTLLLTLSTCFRPGGNVFYVQHTSFFTATL